MIPSSVVHVARRPDNPYNVKETVEKLRADMKCSDECNKVVESNIAHGNLVEATVDEDEDYDIPLKMNTPVATITSKDYSMCRYYMNTIFGGWTLTL